MTDIVGLEFPDQVPSPADLARQQADANTKLTLALALGALGTVGLVVSIVALTKTRRVV